LEEGEPINIFNLLLSITRPAWLMESLKVQKKFPWPLTDKKENRIFLIYKEIQSGAVAKSYMTNSLLIYGEYLRISSYIRNPFLIYDFATAPL
jgi:hypothetical protein